MCVFVVTCCLIVTVVDLLSDGAQGDGPLNDVIVVRYLATGDTSRQAAQCVSVCDCVSQCARMSVYLGPGHQLHEGPAIRVSHQLHHQLLARRHLVEAMVPARGAAAGGGRARRGGGASGRQDWFGSHV